MEPEVEVKIPDVLEPLYTTEETLDIENHGYYQKLKQNRLLLTLIPISVIAGYAISKRNGALLGAVLAFSFLGINYIKFGRAEGFDYKQYDPSLKEFLGIEEESRKVRLK